MMAETDQLTALRARLTAAGLGGRDLAWLEDRSWSDRNIPAISSATERTEYARREAALNAAIASLSSSERGASIEGKLAAALGARIADFDDRGEEEEER
ncbi:hypothetical protein [Terrarubrum flagellatum]|uniref:hypothetical protein n=1 Tax=Terrirubrum flagellatum TaxID=2895980 RepID=UPI0031456F1B